MVLETEYLTKMEDDGGLSKALHTGELKSNVSHFPYHTWLRSENTRLGPGRVELGAGCSHRYAPLAIYDLSLSQPLAIRALRGQPQRPTPAQDGPSERQTGLLHVLRTPRPEAEMLCLCLPSMSLTILLVLHFQQVEK